MQVEVVLCAWCGRVRESRGPWSIDQGPAAPSVDGHANGVVSRGLCTRCEEYLKEHPPLEKRRPHEAG